MEKRKLYGAIIGILVFILMIAGLTYAWFTWASGNTTISGTSGCFTIDYTQGTAISGNLSPSLTYSGGKSTTVKLNIKSGCTVKGQATIKLTTNTSSTIPFTGNAVKYAVYKGSTSVSTGTITATGSKDLATVTLTTTATTYTVYVWVDASIVDNSYIGKAYSGTIAVAATQTE